MTVSTCEWPTITDRLQCRATAVGEIQVHGTKKRVCRTHFDRFNRLKRVLHGALVSAPVRTTTPV